MEPGEINKIFEKAATDFDEAAMAVFRFQYDHNALYRQFCTLLKKNPGNISEISQVPFLPISFFKTHQVKTTAFEPTMIFESSGTTGSTTSRHYVKDISLYERSYTKGFEQLYGAADQYSFLALLPSYLERNNSSLVWMVNGLMQKSGGDANGFFLHDHQRLADRLKEKVAAKEKIFLIGVTYALLDFAESFPMELGDAIVMETGGMKGRKKEMIRTEVHEILKEKFSVAQIHSEYGMTELLSQAYAKESGLFETPPWMKLLIAEEDDPAAIRTRVDMPAAGSIQVIDLANIYSCSFIATEDIGRLHPSGKMEVLGRKDNSDIRGCSLLAL